MEKSSNLSLSLLLQVDGFLSNSSRWSWCMSWHISSKWIILRPFGLWKTSSLQRWRRYGIKAIQGMVLGTVWWTRCFYLGWRSSHLFFPILKASWWSNLAVRFLLLVGADLWNEIVLGETDITKARVHIMTASSTLGVWAASISSLTYSQRYFSPAPSATLADLTMPDLSIFNTPAPYHIITYEKLPRTVYWRLISNNA